MAESVMTDLLVRHGGKGSVLVSSAAAHTDEIGNPPHRGTAECLWARGIPLVPHRARLMTARDGDSFDLLIGMDVWNVRDMKRIVGEKNADKVKMLLDFSDRPRPIADPWYTGNFDESFRDILEGCEGLYEYLKAQGLLN